MPAREAACAIDFGTSNSAIAVLGSAAGTRLVELEPGARTMPTAVFYLVDGPDDSAGPPRLFGRAAIAAYVDGLDGRLMRSMKSILGSSLLDQTTEVGGGRGVKYRDVVAGYLRHLKRLAEAEVGAPITRAVLGRPVFFVDDDAAHHAGGVCHEPCVIDEDRAFARGHGQIRFVQQRCRAEPAEWLASPDLSPREAVQLGVQRAEQLISRHACLDGRVGES